MAVDPRSANEIYDSLKSSLSGKIAKLENFLANSFNAVWINAYSEELHEAEVKLVAAQLSGWVDYAGNDNLTQGDLDTLNIDGASPDEINQYMEDVHLDRLAPIVGVSRDPGERATGQVTVQTESDSTRVPNGMEVSTVPDNEGYLSFYVDLDSDYVTPSSGSTSVTVYIIAEDVGDEYNVGAGAISRLPNPPVGVEGVVNNQETTGGVGEQSNEEFRADIKNAVFEGSGGGTARGIEGYIEENVSGVADVSLDEFYNQQPPFVDVIVDGGSEYSVETAISESRPTGIRHNLVRPEIAGLGVRTELVGVGIDTATVESEIREYLTELTLDQEFHRSRLVQRILNSDDGIEDIGSLTPLLLSVSRDSDVYQSGTSVYSLDFGPLGLVQDEERVYDSDQNVYGLAYTGGVQSSSTVVATVNGDQTELVAGTDYSFVDDDGDGTVDSIDFSVGGSSPDNNTVFEVQYEHSSWSIDSTITDADGNSYSQGTDWALTDSDGDGLNDSIDWSIGGSSPADNVRFFVDYSPGRTISRDVAMNKREKVGAESRIDIETIDPDTL